tara:strand:- start:1277 stop:2062 length:786 start_codon:yes stop_codon:yes gene_type:complete
MQTRLKYLKDIVTAIIRVLTISLIMVIIWISNFWGEQKYLKNNPSIYINGSTVLSNNYYIQYLKSSSGGEPYDSGPNALLDKIYKNPFVKGARVSYRYPDKIILEISERIPFARVNNGPDHMIMLDEDCFVIPDNEQVKNYSVPTLSRFNSEPELYPIGEKALSVKIEDTISWLRLLNKRHPDLYHSISEIFLTNNDEINLVLAENPTKIMLGNHDTHYKIELLKAFQNTIVSKKEITDFAYLDMRYSNQVIVKERNAEYE